MPSPDQQQQQPQQLSLVSRVLFSSDPKSAYGSNLLRPFNAACSEGHAAALRTITHLQLYKWQEQGVPCSRQLAVLEAADQATALTLCTEQLGGLLKAYEQQRDLAALEATLAHILDMEEGLRGAPFVAASSSSSSSRATSAVAEAAPRVPAAKPHGPQLTHLTVFGQHTKDTVQQLVALLDMLPYTQQLSQLFLQASNNSMLEKSRKEDTGQVFGGTWPWEVFTAAAAAAAAQPNAEAGATQPSTSTTTSSSRAEGYGTVPPTATTWRSSCKTVVADMRVMDQIRAPYATLSPLAPLLEAVQQLQVLGLDRMDVGYLPKYSAHLQSLRAFHIQSVEVSNPSVLGAIAGLTNLRHLGIVWGQRDLSIEPVTYIPAALRSLVCLTSLDLNGTYLTEQGLAGVFTLTALKQLDLSDTCYFEALPNSISRLVHLEYFRMYNATVVCLPDCMTALTALRRLEWGTNDTPLQLGVVWRLRSLQHLVLYDDTMQALL
jgi:hypothetical protein